MKDYYSESKKHKFIITNKTDSYLMSEDFAKLLFSKIVRDAKNKFILPPKKSIQIECNDDWENLFDAYLINNFDNAWARGDSFIDDGISVKYCEERQ